MTTQDRRSSKNQKVIEKKQREHDGPTNLFIGTNINVNMTKNGAGTIGDHNVIESTESSKDAASDDPGLWPSITKIYSAIKEWRPW